MIEFDIPDPDVVGVRAYAISIHDSMNKRASVPINTNGNKQRDYFGHPRDNKFGIGTHAAAGVIKIIRFSLLIAEHLQLGQQRASGVLAPL